MQDSNLRPPAPKAGALPDCANIRIVYLLYSMYAYKSTISLFGKYKKSMLDLCIVEMASSNISTIVSFARLNDVLNSTGTPVIL